MAFLGKEYKFEKEENYEGFLKSLGRPAEEIAMLSQYKPSTKLEKNGDEYTYTSITPAGTKVVKFKSGVEQDEEVRKGITVKTTYTVDGNTVTQVVKHGDGKQVTFKKEYSGDKLKVTITSSFWDGVAVREFKA